jgi:hypothetical protein
MNNFNDPQLLNLSESAAYLGTTSNWINFLLEHNLIERVILPQYTKPRIIKRSLDEFIERARAFTNNPDKDLEFKQVSFLASKKHYEIYSRFENFNCKEKGD